MRFGKQKSFYFGKVKEQEAMGYYRPPRPQQKGVSVGCALAAWACILLCVLFVGYVCVRANQLSHSGTVVYMATYQVGSLYYKDAQQFEASGTIQVDYSASCVHDSVAGWDVWFAVVHVQELNGSNVSGPIGGRRVNCGDSGSFALAVDDGTYAPAVSASPGTRWSLTITQLT